MAEEDSQVGCELFKGGEGVLGMDSQLCIGMPASHHEQKVQDVGIVGLWKDAIKHRQNALGVSSGRWCHLGLTLHIPGEGLHSCGQRASSSAMHCQQTGESHLCQMVGQAGTCIMGEVGIGSEVWILPTLPFIKTGNGNRGVELEQSDNVGE